jgi:NarL family two-component system response regulator LiaR
VSGRPVDADGMRNDPVRVVIAHGDPLARRAIRDALEGNDIVVIAEAGNGRDALQLTLHYGPDVLMMDVVLPGLAGLTVTSRVLERNPGIAVVLLANDDGDDMGIASLRAGALGFLPKTVAPSSLPRVVRAAASGEPVVTWQLTKRLIDSLRHSSPDGHGTRPVRSPLTARQWEVLDLLCDGMSNDEIAGALVVSTETVRSHLKNIARTLGVGSREQAIEAARQMRSAIGDGRGPGAAT